MADDDELVEIYPAPEDMSDTARKLLDAADKAGHPVESVATVSGGFRVPAEVAKKAGVHSDAAPNPAPAKKQPNRAPKDS